MGYGMDDEDWGDAAIDDFVPPVVAPLVEKVKPKAQRRRDQIREQHAAIVKRNERIAELEGLLREAREALGYATPAVWAEWNDDPQVVKFNALQTRIESALGEG